MRIVRASLGPALPPGSAVVDTSAFFAGGVKLGIGSSAAVAVVATGAALVAAGAPLAPAQVASLACRAHEAFQGGLGSGADVLAATEGGLRLAARRDGTMTSERLPALPAELVVFATGRASSTVDLLRAVRDFSTRARDNHAALVRALDGAARGMACATAAEDASGVISAARAAHEAMEALGRAADAPIVTPALASAARLAAELGGAAKPSGAGGGDVGVGFFPDGDAARAFGVRAGEFGITILEVTIDPQGVSLHDEAS
jgi:phosphomevalonate kinase